MEMYKHYTMKGDAKSRDKLWFLQKCKDTVNNTAAE